MIHAVSIDGTAFRSRPRFWRTRVIGRSSGQTCAPAACGGGAAGGPGGACRAPAIASAQNVLGTRERISARQPDCEAEGDLMTPRCHPAGAAVDVDLRTRARELVFAERAETGAERELGAAGQLQPQPAVFVLLARDRCD